MGINNHKFRDMIIRHPVYGAEIAGHINASEAIVSAVKNMIIEKWMEWIFSKKI
jgi:hypothetical protein